MFIGRKQEIETLKNMSKSSRFEMAIIYGRRRVGKTTLINEFTKNMQTIYFTATQAGEQTNLENLSRAILSKQKFGENLFYKNFEQALEAVAVQASNKKEPLVFVIDEYSYLAESAEGISSILQKVIDHTYLTCPNLLLILSGSSMSFMEKQVLGYQSPLYGRRTAQLKIRPFSFIEARAFLPDFNVFDFLTIYGITGGVPLYLSMINSKLNLKDNLLQNFFKENSLFIRRTGKFVKTRIARAKSL